MEAPSWARTTPRSTAMASSKGSAANSSLYLIVIAPPRAVMRLGRETGSAIPELLHRVGPPTTSAAAPKLNALAIVQFR